MDQFNSSVENFSCAFEIMGCIHYFQCFALENACVRVYVGMMDDYGLCPMLIEHIAWLLLFG